MRCRLYHKTTWFETNRLRAYQVARLSVADYITKLRGLKRARTARAFAFARSCRLYHKTTWFETLFLAFLSIHKIWLQIISQNYVV